MSPGSKRSIVVAGHKTSVSIEDEFWNCLKEIAGERGMSLAAMIGDTFVKLPPPTGFCELTPRYEFDGRTVAVVSAYMAGDGIKLLAMSADCNQLAEAREGKRQLDDVAAYLVENSDMKMPTPFSVAS